MNDEALTRSRTAFSNSFDVFPSGQVYRRRLRYYWPYAAGNTELPLMVRRYEESIRCDKQWFLHVNYHSYVLELVLSGEMVYDNEIDRTTVHAGEIYVLCAGENSRFAPSGDQNLHRLCLMLSGPSVSGIIEALNLRRQRVVCPTDSAATERCFRQIGRLIKAAAPGGEKKISAMLYSLLLNLAPKLGALQNDRPQALVDILDGMNRHLNEHDFYERMCAMHNINKVTLWRWFRQYLETSPGEYLTRRRIQYAAELLVGGRLPLKAVATDAGFGSYYYFCRVFRARMDSSPGEFRRAALAKANADGEREVTVNSRPSDGIPR